MKSLGIYYRVSTGKQDFASQKSAIKTYLGELPEAERPQTITEFKDHGQSGMDNRREAYLSLIDAAINGRIDTVFVYRLDRLSRDASEAIQLLLRLDQAGLGDSARPEHGAGEPLPKDHAGRLRRDCGT